MRVSGNWSCYLRLSPDCYFDTGYNPKGSWDTEIKFSMEGKSKCGIFGARVSFSDRFYGLFYNYLSSDSSKAAIASVYGKSQSEGLDTGWTIEYPLNEVHVLYKRADETFIDGVKVAGTGTRYSFEVPRTCKIGALQDNNSLYARQNYKHIYWMSIYESGMLKAFYVPCAKGVKVTGSTVTTGPCLVDAVTKSILYPVAGVAQFLQES